jgi:gluconolactonase
VKPEPFCCRSLILAHALAVLLTMPFGHAAAQNASEARVATTVAFTEGPAVDEDGNVFFTETVGHRIMKLSTDRALSVFRENSNAANGLVFDRQWRLVACEGSDLKTNRPRVTRTDMKTGAIEILAEFYESRRLNAPNDVTFDDKDRLYFTDFDRPGPERIGTPGVYRIDPDGRLTRLLGPPDVQRPNGIVISPDDKTLYLVEANGAEKGARMIRAYDLQPDGSLRNMRVFHNFYPGRSADGLAIDSRGNVYAAAGLHRRRGTHETLDTKPGIHVFSPQGKLLRFIPIWEDTITNCAFGGPDLKTLYVTAGKTLFQVPVDIPGTRR